MSSSFSPPDLLLKAVCLRRLTLFSALVDEISGFAARLTRWLEVNVDDVFLRFGVCFPVHPTHIAFIFQWSDRRKMQSIRLVLRFFGLEHLFIGTVISDKAPSKNHVAPPDFRVMNLPLPPFHNYFVDSQAFKLPKQMMAESCDTKRLLSLLVIRAINRHRKA